MQLPIHRFRIDTVSRRTFFRFLVVMLVGGCIALMSVAVLRSIHAQRACELNLNRIYTALEQYEDEFGALPIMAYYPTDVRLDPESLHKVLEDYGLGLTNCVCPATASILRETGITYVWNTQANGKPLHSLEPPQWILVEMNVLSAKVPAPHRGRYNVLYSDGEVRREAQRP